jgi:ABC-2 type transport system permease protein
VNDEAQAPPLTADVRVQHDPAAAFRRVRALIRKESRQLLRDRSNIAVGILLPLILIIIFGYGLSLDVKNVPVAIVMEDSSPTAVDVVSGIQLSRYFSPLMLPSMHEAERLMLTREIDGVVRIRSDFTRQLAAGNASIQLLVHGADANKARIIQGYVQGAIAAWAARRTAEGRVLTEPVGTIAVEQRVWFNEANNSTYFLVPGLIVLVMTLIGALLTALVMAREWERGTLEALFVTPVRSTEILLGKIVPYFGVGLIGLTLCLLAAKFLFFVPLRGSILALLVASMLYLLVALGIGLLISSAVKNQFLASQIALITSFLPALMLSGFLFDLRSVPAVVRYISTVLPATYYVELLQTLFLAGNVWPLILKDCAVLALAATVLLSLARATTQKKLT